MIIASDRSDPKLGELFSQENPERNSGTFIGKDAEQISCILCTGCT